MKNTPLIQDILGAASQSASKFAETEAGQRIGSATTKISETREDLRETWETSQNPWVYRIASAYDNVFSENETGQAIKELRRLDPGWDLHDWMNDIEVETAPDMVQAYLEGDEEALASMCSSMALAQLTPELTERRVKGYVRDPTILDVRNVTLMKTRLMERAPPIMVVSFTSQQIHCVKNARGKIIEGDDDKIMANVYLMAMQRDWDEEEECLKWKILEFSPQGAVDFM